MSGHSKWSNIKNRKAAVDKKRSEVFTKGAKEIMVAVGQGGGNINPETNSFLKTAIDKARGMDMPKENIARLLAKVEARKSNLNLMTLEAYGPFGVPILIEVETDNKNRILAQMKLILRDFGGSLAESGSVKFQFDRVGEVKFSKIDEDKQLDLIDAGAKDIEGNVVVVSPGDLDEMVAKAKDFGLVVVDSRVVMKVKTAKVLGADQKRSILDLVAGLNDNEDVSNIFVGAEGV